MYLSYNSHSSYLPMLLRQLDLLVEVVHPSEEESDGDGVVISPVPIPVADLLPHCHLMGFDTSLFLCSWTVRIYWKEFFTTPTWVSRKAVVMSSSPPQSAWPFGGLQWHLRFCSRSHYSVLSRLAPSRSRNTARPAILITHWKVNLKPKVVFW